MVEPVSARLHPQGILLRHGLSARPALRVPPSRLHVPHFRIRHHRALRQAAGHGRGRAAGRCGGGAGAQVAGAGHRELFRVRERAEAERVCEAAVDAGALHVRE